MHARAGRGPLPPLRPPSPEQAPRRRPRCGASAHRRTRQTPSMHRPAESDNEDQTRRAADLARMKRLATGMLVVATVVFAVTRLLEDRYGWLAYVRATAEAAMVGAV